MIPRWENQQRVINPREREREREEEVKEEEEEEEEDEEAWERAVLLRRREEALLMGERISHLSVSNWLVVIRFSFFVFFFGILMCEKLKLKTEKEKKRKEKKKKR